MTQDLATGYEIIGQIGLGTFGKVFKGKCRKTGTLVAVKEILDENEQEGFPLTALREITILQQNQHKNLVKHIEVCKKSKKSEASPWSSTYFIVYELCHHDLAGLLSKQTFMMSLRHKKDVMFQLLSALYFLHYRKVIHRDIKPANILMNSDGCLKLADFGLARSLIPENEDAKCGHAHPLNPKAEKADYTPGLVTSWYRPPELLLLSRRYGAAVDMWSAGCVFAELFLRTPLLRGSSDIHQLQLVIELCGSICPEVWPGVVDLKLYGDRPGNPVLPLGVKRQVRDRMKKITNDDLAIDLMDKLLCLDPEQRISADGALGHDFFYTNPDRETLKTNLALLTKSCFVLYNEAPAPHVQRIAPAPHFRHNVPAPHIRHNAPAPDVRHHAPASHVRHNAPAPHVQHNASAPNVRQNTSAPNVRHNAPATHVRYNAPAPHVQHNAPSQHVQQSSESLVQRQRGHMRDNCPAPYTRGGAPRMNSIAGQQV